MAKKIPAQDVTRKCSRCHRPFKKTDFYKTYSQVYTSDGFMPICKKCLYELFLQYLEAYGGDTKCAIQRICMLFDIYYDERIFETSNSPDIEVILGNYMKRLNMVQYQNKTFDNSMENGFFFDLRGVAKKKRQSIQIHGLLGEGETVEIGETRKEARQEAREAKAIEKAQKIEAARIAKEESSEFRKKDIKRWGDGLEPTDYKLLNEHYEYLTNANPNYDSNQEVFIKELCYTNMLKQRAIVESNVDDYKKLSETYRKSFEQAGLKTVEETTNAEEFSMAVNVKTIEQYTPAEYYKDKSLYKDHDGIGEYFERFVLRPLRNLQHGSSDRDYEYYVKEEGDFDGQT